MISLEKIKIILKSDAAVPTVISCFPLFLHGLIHPEFGFQRDEFLYIAMADHLDWGYLEAPPGIAVISLISKFLFGQSYFSFHVFPALAGALTVFMTGWIARTMGGNRFAQILAALCVAMSPSYLRSSLLLQPAVFEQLYVTLLAWAIIRLLQSRDLRWWLVIGLISGIGLLNKYSMLLFGFGVAVGILVTSNRKMYLTRWPWLGGGLALLIFFPNLIWQFNRQWPVFDHIKKLAETQLIHVSPLGFLEGQIWMNLFTSFVWLSGIAFFLFTERGRIFRAAGWIYVAALALLLVFSGKDYYLLPAYPMLLAGGSVLIAGWAWIESRKWLKAAAIIFVVTVHLPVIPYGIPIYSVTKMQDFCLHMAERYGLDGPLRWETGRMHKLPQDYADMLGWENIVKESGKVYRELSDQERSECAVIAANYGFAGAIDYYAEKYDLPKSISPNGSYYIWGPRNYTGQTTLLVGVDTVIAGKFFDEVIPAAWATDPYAREDSVLISIARRPKNSIKEVWPQLSGYRY